MRTRQNSLRWFKWLFFLISFSVILWILIGLNGIEFISSSIFPEYYKKITFRREMIREKEQLIRENEELRGKIVSQGADLGMLQEELSVFTEMDRIETFWKGYPGVEGVPARIIFKDPYGLYTSFIINKGSDNGIRKNMPVLGEKAVIGRVIEVKPGYSRIRTIRSPRCSFGATGRKTNDLGVIAGGQNEMTFMYLSINSNIKLGDEVITSGTTDITPAGLLIGTVRELIKNDPEQELIVKVESPEVVEKLLSVWVLTSTTNFPTDLTLKGDSPVAQ
jgi:rod shape-determining protein MreC